MRGSLFVILVHIFMILYFEVPRIDHQSSTNIYIMANQTKAHVLVLPYPAQGHINPLLQFTKCLTSKGIKATFATTHYTLNSIRVPGIDFFPISDGYDKAGYKEAPSLEAYLESFQTVGSESVTDLIRRLYTTSTPVTCLVYDSLLVWGLNVARSLGIYSAAFLTNSASVCAIFRQVDFGRVRLSVEAGDLPVSVPGIPPLGVEEMRAFLVQPPDPYLMAVMEMFALMDKNDFVFTNSFDMLENEVAKAMLGQWPVQMVGPLVPSAFLNNTTETDTDYGSSLWQLPQGSTTCTDWLNTKPPKSVVYISFGSMSQIPPVQLEQIAHGLIDCGTNFLWVVREAENRELLKKLLLTRVDSHRAGLLVPWCNQVEVLLNDAVGCFVTHCGWNSTLEAISFGVPVVAMPERIDQPLNAKFAEDVWQIGVRAKRDGDGVFTAAEVKRCVEEVMKGERSEEYRKNALKWGNLAKEAMSPGGTSHENINEFVKVLVKD